jgi:glutaredoxin
MISSLKTVITLLLAFLALLVPAIVATDLINSTPILRSETAALQTPAPELNSSSRATYQGYLRIYLVEPESRYVDFYGKNFQFGFLDFAVNQAIAINDGERLSDTVTWNAGTFGSVALNNIEAIAVVFNSEGHPAYSYPANNTYPFTAHWTDAAAASTPGVLAVDNHTGAYTHRVFLEEATRNGCPYCPITREALDDIYWSGNYQFLYAAMVTDNPKAIAYLTSYYNVGAVPTVYFDGGHSVFVGGSPDQSDYTSKINLASIRTVPSLKLAVKLNFINTTQLSVEYIVKSSNQAPAVPQVPSGADIARVGSIKYFSSSAADLDGDQVFYRWVFDNTDSSVWMGPYNSGDTCMIAHSWSAPGNYQVSLISKDYWDATPTGSSPHYVQVYLCGDADGNGRISVSDAVKLINYIFSGGLTPSPIQAGDADCNGAVNVSDAVRLINYIFAGGLVPCANCP